MLIPSPDSQQQLIEKINRLQQRQSLLLQQTNTELEDLKNELGSAVSEDYIYQITVPLQNELLDLKNQNTILEQEKKYLNGQLNHLHHQFRSYFAKSQAILESLKENIANPFSDENELMPLLDTPPLVKVEPALITQAAPTPTPVLVLPIAPNPLPPPPLPTTPTPALVKPINNKRRPFKRLAFTAFSFLLVAAGYTGWHKFTTINSTSSINGSDSSGQVAGASTDSSITQGTDLRPDSQKYQESFAKVAFEDTQWQTTTNSALNIKLQYPSNASNMVYTPGSDNVWFLRESGYMFKVNTQEIAPETTLDQYMQDNQADFSDYTMSKSTFKNIPCWQGVPIKTSNTGGTQYVLKVGIHLYTIWAHNTTDETEKHWIDHMIASLEFLPN